MISKEDLIPSPNTAGPMAPKLNLFKCMNVWSRYCERFIVPYRMGFTSIENHMKKICHIRDSVLFSGGTGVILSSACGR